MNRTLKQAIQEVSEAKSMKFQSKFLKLLYQDANTRMQRTMEKLPFIQEIKSDEIEDVTYLIDDLRKIHEDTNVGDIVILGTALEMWDKKNLDKNIEVTLDRIVRINEDHEVDVFDGEGNRAVVKNLYDVFIEYENDPDTYILIITPPKDAIYEELPNPIYYDFHIQSPSVMRSLISKKNIGHKIIRNSEMGFAIQLNKEGIITQLDTHGIGGEETITNDKNKIFSYLIKLYPHVTTDIPFEFKGEDGYTYKFYMTNNAEFILR